MDWLNIFAIAVSLSMDALAVALATGIAIRPLTKMHVIRMSSAFGIFQAVMPAIGWAAGSAVQVYISSFDHWVAFGLLAFVGGKMVFEALREKDDGEMPAGDPTRGWNILMLSIATSIDALAVGLSLAVLGVPILIPVLVFGFVTAGITASGMILGRRIGAIWGRRVEVLGGLVLIAIGARILIEHML